MVSPSFQRRTGPGRLIDCFGLTLTARDIDGRFTNGQVKLSTLQDAATGRLRLERALKLPR